MGGLERDLGGLERDLGGLERDLDVGGDFVQGLVQDEERVSCFVAGTVLLRLEW